MTSSASTKATFGTSARLLGLVNALVGIGLAIVSAQALSDLAARRLSDGLAILAGVLAARWLFSTTIEAWNNHCAQAIRNRWRAGLVGHFDRPRSEGQRNRGDLALAIDRAADAPSLRLLGASAQFSVLGLVAIFWAAGWMGAAITVGLLVLAIPLYQRAGTRSAAISVEYNERRALLASRQLELLGHAPELRALGAVSFGANEIAAISDSEHAIALRAIRVALESSLVTEFLSGVSIGLVAMVVGFGLLHGRLTLFHALIGVLVTSELFVHVRRYGSEFHRREDATASLALLASVETIRAAATGDALISAHELVTEAGPSPVSLRVTAASRFYVSGPSGSGKTTLLHTLLGWRSARQGLVERSDARVGYVSVESQLISGSLWDNLTLDRDSDPAVVAHLLGVLGLVGARFDDLDTELLADGRGLSGGERVRLVLARCLLAEVDLLVLDDIAGVLDATSRECVIRALDEHPRLAIIEASVDSPLLGGDVARIEVGS